MTTTLAQKIKANIAESVATYQPTSAGQKRFVLKHFDAENRPTMAPGFEGNKDRAGNSLDLYRGNTKVAARPGHGYAAAPSTEDEKVYEGKTYRHSDNSKHMKRSGVKKYFQRKRKGDDKRLQEDQLDELSKKTLGSYVKKAVNSFGMAAMDLKAGKREDGINLAVSRLAGNKYPNNVSTTSRNTRRAKLRKESLDIPENEEIYEIVTDVNEAAAQQQDVRALRGKIIHRQFVGMIGASAEQEHYRIQDTAGRTHHVFTNKELGKKGDKIDLHVAEYKKGGGILSVSRKNVVKESLNEGSRFAGATRNRHSGGTAKLADNGSPRDAHDTYIEHSAAIKHLLSHIGGVIDDHNMRVSAPRDQVTHDANGPKIMKVAGKAHWGHVGDMKAYRRQLEDLRDSMTQNKEYSLPQIQAGMKEEFELNELNDNDAGLDLAGIRKKMMDANKVHQLGVKHGDTLIQSTAKTRLQQLAKLHANLSQKANEQVTPEFAAILDEVQSIIAEPVVTLSARFVEALGEELAQRVLESYETLDDEGKEILLTLIRTEEWEQIVDAYKGSEE